MDIDANDFLDFTTSWRDVVAVIEQVGMDSVADRISHLYGLANDDPSEVPIRLESLQRFALFIMGRQHLPRPRIGVNPDGVAQAVWRISEGGVLAMNFLPAGDSDLPSFSDLQSQNLYGAASAAYCRRTA